MKLLMLLLLLGTLLASCGSKDNGNSDGTGNPGGANNGGGGTDPEPPVATVTCNEVNLLSYINIYRSENKREPLKISKSATLAAKWMAEDLSTTKKMPSHTDTLGREPEKRLPAFGFDYYNGENISYGYAKAATVFCNWMQSKKDVRNILSSKNVSIGLGNFESPDSFYNYYWTIDFGYDLNDDDVLEIPKDIHCPILTVLPKC